MQLQVCTLESRHFSSTICQYLRLTSFFHLGFSDEKDLLDHLRRGEAKAILYLQDKSEGFAADMLRKNKLALERLPDVLNDACVILLKKIREPEFAFQTATLNTYFLGIVKNVVLNKTREAKARMHEVLEDHHHLVDETVEDYYQRKDRIELLNHLLKGAGEKCAKIIRLKYVDGFSDEETIERALTPHKSTESLRQKRSQCMKKIREAVSAKGFFIFI